MSVTADTSQDPIGPCVVYLQWVDRLRHCTIPALSSALSFGAQPAVGYCRGRTGGVSVRVRVRLRYRVGFPVGVRFGVGWFGVSI